MPYSPDQLFRVSNNISITNIEDESVVLDPENNRIEITV